MAKKSEKKDLRDEKDLRDGNDAGAAVDGVDAVDVVDAMDVVDAVDVVEAGEALEVIPGTEAFIAADAALGSGEKTVVPVYLKKQWGRTSLPYQVGDCIGTVTLAEGVCLNTLVDAVRNGYASDTH